MCHIAKNPSLELGWLLRHEKQLVQPKVVFTENDNWGGRYIQPFNGQMLIDNMYVDADNGIIEISNNHDDCINVMAHEFRHHWQIATISGCLGRSSLWQNSDDYKADIISYFTSQRWEMDALLFELRTYPTDTALEWMDWIKE